MQITLIYMCKTLYSRQILIQIRVITCGLMMETTIVFHRICLEIVSGT